MAAAAGPARVRAAPRPAWTAVALALAWEYHLHNDGGYDPYRAETLTDLAASLLDHPVWRLWWD